ncbi:hypothetical protein [Streptomyces sp. SID12488]|uniref:hypothetical protein n=1 Tax=Streptomyces sp. SID12488 TaxID=2706040 RepID=UPI0013DA57AD|nr:hypothetical protein [Streptomyces sp. SID12488]NEA62217.1 hypothetical protein [Streptomyces sp. SID12488]
MTNKTRIRVARIAAGAVIAAGASFTAAGIASATDGDDCVIEVCAGTPSPDEPTDPVTEIPTDPAPTTADPETSQPEEPEPTESAPDTSEPEEPSTEPSEPTEEDPTATPSDDSTGDETGTGGDGSDGGNSNTDPDGGSNTSVQEEGSSALTDTGSDTSAQGSGDELAETGAAETGFLIIGAATMIAGGIAFRVLPRLVGGRGGAAA